MTVAFTISCYGPSGDDLGSYRFSQYITNGAKVNLITVMKSAGISIDSMKAAGSKFVISNITSWMQGNKETYISFVGQTTGCF